ncbi:uncharacterized protein LOC135712696 [Ochlerotatus camptorhynchus]|uniref:uncharacterized protein LOC135712696 n=1 Tax=Ochlerotatus camptorhynchus TaxID=644619 RepID=UPI0031D98DD1
MSSERRIKALKVRLRSLQTSFTLIHTFMDEFDVDTDVHQVPVRLEHLSTLWVDFNKTQSELESLDEAGLEQQFKSRSEFESAYYKVKGFLLANNKTPISANNYMVAWKLLEDHYQNPVRLKQTYVDALFEFSTIKRESAAELHSLVEKFESNVKVLQQLGEQTQCWDLLLVRMLSTRLDPTTRRDWEEYASTQNVVSFQALTTFIHRRVNVLQTIQVKTIENPTVTTVKKPTTRPLASHGAAQLNARKCLMCSDHHPLYRCSSFSNLSVEEKEKEVRRHQLCRNCLRKGHVAKDCSSSSTCRKCRSRHHTQLCANDGSNSGKPKPESSTVNHSPLTDQQSNLTVSATAIDPTSYASAGQSSKRVLLATAVVILVDDTGVQHAARALLDSGSECCFITETLSQSLTVRRKKISLPIAGIGRSSTQARQKFISTIRSRTSDFVATVEFLVLPRLTVDLPSTSIDITSWKIPPELQLADPAFYQANPVDLILGAEVFFDIFNSSDRIQLGEYLPVLVNSTFGWPPCQTYLKLWKDSGHWKKMNPHLATPLKKL